MEKRFEHVIDLDFNHLKESNKVFNTMYKKSRRFREIYQEGDVEKQRCVPVNPVKYETNLQTMQRRKLEQECQRHMK